MSQVQDLSTTVLHGRVSRSRPDLWEALLLGGAVGLCVALLDVLGTRQNPALDSDLFSHGFTVGLIGLAVMGVAVVGLMGRGGATWSSAFARATRYTGILLTALAVTHLVSRLIESPSVSAYGMEWLARYDGVPIVLGLGLIGVGALISSRDARQAT